MSYRLFSHPFLMRTKQLCPPCTVKGSTHCNWFSVFCIFELNRNSTFYSEFF